MGVINTFAAVAELLIKLICTLLFNPPGVPIRLFNAEGIVIVLARPAPTILPKLGVEVVGNTAVTGLATFGPKRNCTGAAPELTT